MQDQNFDASLGIIQHNTQAAQEQAAKASEGNSDVKRLKTAKAGDYIGFIMPPFNSRGVSAKLVGTRFGLKNADGDDTALTDLVYTFPELRLQDPVRAVIEKYKRAGLTTIEDYGSQALSKKAFFNFIPIETPEHGIIDKREVVVFEQTPQTLTYFTETLNSRHYVNPVTHPMYGCPIKITRKETKKGNNTKVEYSRSFLPQQPWFPGLSQEEQVLKVKELLGQMYDLDELYKAPQVGSDRMKLYEEIAEILERTYAGRLRKLQEANSETHVMAGQAANTIQNMQPAPQQHAVPQQPAAPVQPQAQPIPNQPVAQAAPQVDPTQQVAVEAPPTFGPLNQVQNEANQAPVQVEAKQIVTEGLPQAQVAPQQPAPEQPAPAVQATEDFQLPDSPPVGG